MENNEVNVGDVFICKRRGHRVEVTYAEPLIDTVMYRNARGETRRIKISRLLNPSRFARAVPAAQEA